MPLQLERARQEVVEAGRRLLSQGLIARTWGNVSCRISAHQFVITPSGLAYDHITPAEIVTVNIADGSYVGDLAPSSEKGMHAAVYRVRKDVNFIIHTHQTEASALSPLGLDFPVLNNEDQLVLGRMVRHIPYGLPGSKALRKNVAVVIQNSEEKAYLMAAHGALCLGSCSSEVFKVAERLEHFCKKTLIDRYLELSGRKIYREEDFFNYYFELATGQTVSQAEPAGEYLYSSERQENHLLFYLDQENTGCDNPLDSKVLRIPLADHKYVGPKEQHIVRPIAIHRAIYLKRREVGAIVHSRGKNMVAQSVVGQSVYPLLDDFAQIVGISAPKVDLHRLEDQQAVKRVVASLRKREAVLLHNQGALCCGPDLKDARAAAMIVEKNCRAYLAGTYFGVTKPINRLECHLMRYIYKKRYSRKAEM